MGASGSLSLFPILTLEIGVIIGVSRLLGLLFRRVHQPQVIGEVVAGILLGPSFLGWIAPGLSAALFPPAALPYLQMLSEYGIVFFMFLVGLELKPGLLPDYGRVAVGVSTSSVVVPFVLGVLLSFALQGSLRVPGVSPAVFAVFLGTAMAITAFPVLARILVERDLLRSQLGTTALTCAAVNDLVAWCLLSVVVTVARGMGPVDSVIALGRAGLFVAVMVGLVRPLLRRVEALYETRGSLSQNQFSVVLVLLVVAAAGAHGIGLHAIFGAFLFGAILPKRGAFARELVEKMEDFAVVFFLPIYFAYTGLRTEVGLLNSPFLWMASLAVIGAAVSGKLFGSALAAHLLGLSWREATALGVLMNTRGLMELVILNLGLDLRIITPELFAIMVIMALATTLMTMPALALVYPVTLWRETPAEAGEGAALVAVALPSTGPRLADLAAWLAPSPAPRVYAVHVARPPERGALGAGMLGAPSAEASLQPVVLHGRARQLDIRPVALTSRSPADDICEAAEHKGCALIVMGWHKPVFARSVLGGTVERVMRRFAGDVLVFMDKNLPASPRRILVAYGGTEHCRRALLLADRMAVRLQADLTLLEVVRQGHHVPPLATGTARWTDHQVIESGDPVETVIAAAREYDLTVVGIGEEWEVTPSTFGLRTERIASRCPSSLLIVRAGS